jgi:hypothetical protein
VHNDIQGDGFDDLKRKSNNLCSNAGLILIVELNYFRAKKKKKKWKKIYTI